jgi:hypothetical protein
MNKILTKNCVDVKKRYAVAMRLLQNRQQASIIMETGFKTIELAVSFF